MQIEMLDTSTEQRLKVSGSQIQTDTATLKSALLEIKVDKRQIIIDCRDLEMWNLGIVQLLLAFIRDRPPDIALPVIFCSATASEYLRLLGLQSNGLEEILHVH